MAALGLSVTGLPIPSVSGAPYAIRARLALENSGVLAVKGSEPSFNWSDEFSASAMKLEPRVASFEGENALLGDVARYYSLKELSLPPLAKGELELDVPDQIFRGRVTLRVWVGSEGRVQKVECLEADVPAWMTQRVIIAFGLMDFVPGDLMGTPVGSWFDADIDLGYIQQGRRGEP